MPTRLPMTLVLALAALLRAGPGAAQSLLDWPVRVTAGADALTSGAAAVFWNPAAIGPGEASVEALIADLEAPSLIGLHGVGLAAVVRATDAIAFGAGYAHLRIDGIVHTTTSPDEAGPRPEVRVAENRAMVTVAHAIGPALALGVGVREIRSEAAGRERRSLSYGAGAIYRRSGLPLRPAVGAAGYVTPDGLRWLVGVEATPRAPDPGSWGATVDYGLSGAPGAARPAQRAVAGLRWRDWLGLSLGLAGEPEPQETVWVPVAAVRLDLGRYTVMVTRESLANRFDAAHSFALSVVF